MPDAELLTAEQIDPKDTDVRTPQGYLTVDLTDADRAKLEPWVKNHLEQIETALADVHCRFEEERNQFEGLMPGGDYPYPGAFRVNVPLTKKKVREIANRLKQAYLDSDPIWAVVSHTLPTALTAQIEKALDHQVDNELNLADDLSQCVFESVLHGAGVGAPGWAYREDVRRDVAVYRGFDGLTVQSLADLARFEVDYPNWREDDGLRDLHQQLAKGKDVRDEISYRTATVNRPDFVHIPVKDVRAYPHLNSPDDLQFSPLYGYVKEYTQQELEMLAADETLDETQLGRVFPKPDSPSALDEMESYALLRATIRYQLSEDDEPVRYKIWYEQKSGAILRI